MVDIKNIHNELITKHFLEEDIDEELEIIEKRYEEAVQNILRKISELRKEEKVVA